MCGSYAFLNTSARKIVLSVPMKAKLFLPALPPKHHGRIGQIDHIVRINHQFFMRPTSKLMPRRMAILAKDIAVITGLSDRSARRLIQQIKIAYGKEEHAFVTIAEFCNFGGFPEDEVREIIQ